MILSMDIENAKKCIDSQLIKAIYSDYPIDNFHPTRVIQALKSLIGINIEEPSRKLIEWGDSYLDNINLLPDDYYKYPINKSKETIVLSDIGNYILQRDQKKCITELQDLCSVSDGSQIFEYLLEFASIHNKWAIPFIWSGLRTNLFMKSKYSYHLLVLSVEKLLRQNKNHNHKPMPTIELYSIIESIKASILTRQERIDNHLNQIIPELNLSETENTVDLINISQKGRVGILNYLNSLESNQITRELILFLDACRMVLKDSSNKNKQNMTNILNNVIEKRKYVEKYW